MSLVAYVKESRLPRILAGHPWVYDSDLLPVKKAPEDGQVIAVRSQQGSFLGKGFYNARSSIRIRLATRDKNEEVDGSWLRRRIEAAVEHRRKFCRPRPASRLVWSEADGLSGLIVDQYAETIVIQTLSLAMDLRKTEVAAILRELFNPRFIVERNDVTSRKHEGLAEQSGLLYPAEAVAPDPAETRIGSALFEVDWLKGHKTGTYLDQQENWEKTGAFARDRDVLDCFTYEGGFAIHAAQAGAKSVDAIDISEDTIARCRKNATLNRVAVRFETANVFDRLKTLVDENRRYGMVILDPPSFTRSRGKLEEALRGYKQIHLKAFKLLEPGGLLATFCCSHHVDAETFRAVALDAAFDTRRTLRLIHSFSQPLDHPVVPAIPESEYLKGFLFEVM